MCDDSMPVILEPGTVLNKKYQIKKMIGAGGFGTTYLAFDQVLKMPVAVKEYKRQYYISEKDKLRFLNEARTMGKFAGNPGIVNVRDYFEANHTVYIVMEYLDGLTLKEFIEKNGRMSAGQAFAYMKPVMQVLDKIHGTGFIHRDISPDNIMVLDEEIKLLDFGAARDVRNTEGTLSIIFKPGYAPEEQCRSENDQGPWTDVYAMCATIYKCVTGITPKGGQQRLYEDDLSRPSKLGIEIPPAFEAVLMEGLAVRREERISSMKELLEKMQEALRNDKKDEEFPERDFNTVKGEPYEKQTIIEHTEKAARDQKDKRKTREILDSEKVQVPKSLLCVLAGAAIVFFIVFVINFMESRNPYKATDTSSRVQDVTVTVEMLDKIDRDKDMTTLYLDTCRVDDIAVERLSHMKNLKMVKFTNCTGFTSLKALQNLENLNQLIIVGDSQNIQNLPEHMFTEGVFPQVKYLTLNYVSLSDEGSSLKGFTGLEHFDLSNTKGIKTLDFLKEMKALRILELENVQISGADWSVLGFCTELYRLNAVNAGIDDLSGLTSCRKLRELMVSGAGIADISPLVSCTELEMARLRGNQIKDISPLAECREMTSLDLGENQIEDVSILKGMTKLRSLELDHNQITDMEPVKSCSKLEYLNLEDNQISDISPLSNQFTQLMTLRLSENQVNTLEPLENCLKLTELRADKNQLSSLKGLEKKFYLRELSVWGNKLQNIMAIQDSPELSYMDFGNNQIRDITALSGLTKKVEGLLLDQNLIEDISLLPVGIEYKVLALQENPISDYSVLNEMEKINKYQDMVMISYTEDLDYNSIMDSAYENRLYFVDVPLEQQANYTKAFEEKHKGASYLVPFESKQDMNERMKKIREKFT